LRKTCSRKYLVVFIRGDSNRRTYDREAVNKLRIRGHAIGHATRRIIRFAQPEKREFKLGGEAGVRAETALHRRRLNCPM